MIFWERRGGSIPSGVINQTVTPKESSTLRSLLWEIGRDVLVSYGCRLELTKTKDNSDEEQHHARIPIASQEARSSAAKNGCRGLFHQRLGGSGSGAARAAHALRSRGEGVVGSDTH